MTAMIYARLSELPRYPFLVNVGAWNEAFTWLQSIPTAPSCQTYPLRGKEMFVNVMKYTTVLPTESRFESHRQYVDLQYTIGGAEQIEVLHTSDLLPDGDYDADKDLQFYRHPNRAPTKVDMQPGWFSIFFPEDAHRPKIYDDTHPDVYKLVIKISCDLLR